MFKFILIIVLSININLIYASAPGKAGTKAKYETDFIVDLPTAGVIPYEHGSGIVNFMPQDGLYFEVFYAPLNSLLIGLSYGGNGIIGNKEPKFQKLPGLTIKYRIFDERTNFPAISLGFRSQGGGNYNSVLERFFDYSPGFFLAFSKAFYWELGEIAIHSGVNYSFEPGTNDRSPDAYFGIEQAIGIFTSLNIEYDLALDEDLILINRRGRLNAAIRFSVVEGVTLGLKLRDLTNSVKYNTGVSRQFFIDLVKNIN